MPEADYPTIIERGHTATCDAVIDFLKPRIRAPYLDIGCNAGWLLSEVPGGTGIDASRPLIQLARGRNLDARLGHAEKLEFNDGEFLMAVLSNVLEQCADWRAVVREARRVALRVIGVNPIPEASQWGRIGGWVKSVIPEAEMRAEGFRTQRISEQKYYFELA